ncbi:hypothetical protein B5E58_12280 [Tyzzerella sp. An114]|nr:hypothetical protein B5E58_12280 [Tyzzerella sp. An114]
MKQISRKYIIVFILFFISMFYNILFILNLNDLSKNIYSIYYEYIYLFITTPVLYLSFAIIFGVIIQNLLKSKINNNIKNICKVCVFIVICFYISLFIFKSNYIIYKFLYIIGEFPQIFFLIGILLFIGILDKGDVN